MFFWLKKKTPVSALKDGAEAVIEGSVIAKTELALSGSGTRCVYFDKLNESFETGQRGRGRKMWVPKNFEQKCTGFFVDDGTGRIWVASETAGFEVQGGARENGTIGKKGTLRFVAQFIRQGDMVRVSGQASKPKGAEPSECLVFRPNRKGRLRISVRRRAAG